MEYVMNPYCFRVKFITSFSSLYIEYVEFFDRFQNLGFDVILVIYFCNIIRVICACTNATFASTNWIFNTFGDCGRVLSSVFYFLSDAKLYLSLRIFIIITQFARLDLDKCLVHIWQVVRINSRPNDVTAAASSGCPIGPVDDPRNP